MTTPSKHELTREVLPRYLQATKAEKTQILNEFRVNTGYHRKYAIQKLRDFQRRTPAERENRPRKGRKTTYGPDCLPPLKAIWEFLEYPCGERLQPYLAEILPKLEAAGFLHVGPDVRKKLLAMSARTMDRLLKNVRKVRRRRIQATTKPGTLLQHEIPVRHEPWPAETVPGYLELDLVAHCGETNAGDDVSTLTVTDIATGWTEHGAVLGKSQRHTIQMLEEIAARLPFPLCGIDPDNDGQFINWHLKGWCDARGIQFTRSRAYKKNDNAHVEQKNWSTVRQVLGYKRFDAPEELRLIQALYAGPLRDWQNFFQPTLKLKEKVRVGARLIKRHDRAQTPYQRVLASPHVSEERKEPLRQSYAQLNPVSVKRETGAILKRLFSLH